MKSPTERWLDSHKEDHPNNDVEACFRCAMGRHMAAARSAAAEDGLTFTEWVDAQRHATPPTVKDVPVYDPDSGHYIGDVRVCASCGQIACLDGAPCGKRREAVWPPREERR